ncbi:hypothetical protein [Lederbergia galactosidilytica]|nr:hypothetical protein [Lederbergia galactosidilytica]MBP1915039.1 F0F1-type ATP synthase assembly protein I [Lederbergia galactosidilytica]
MKYESGGVVFIGCIILGVGLGILFDKTGAGSLIGLGVGFIAMGFFRNKR